MMTIALLSSSVLTLASAFSTNFETIVILAALKGLALSGLPAIAMAYLSEEIDQRSLGMSMGLYIGGNILGGMAGRVMAAFVADLFSWRVSVAMIGLVCLAIFTFGFFGAHTVASSWVGRRATEGRAIASALYLFFYYIGSSLLGSYSGVMLRAHGWHGVVALLSIAVVISLAVAIAMRRAYGNTKPV